MSISNTLVSAFRSSVALSVVVTSAWSGASLAAGEPAIQQAASGAVTKSAERVSAGGQVTKKIVVPATAGGVTAKGGEKEYPAGTMPIPPKPKKEALEAAGALKAKAQP